MPRSTKTKKAGKGAKKAGAKGGGKAKTAKRPAKAAKSAKRTVKAAKRSAKGKKPAAKAKAAKRSTSSAKKRTTAAPARKKTRSKIALPHEKQIGVTETFVAVMPVEVTSEAMEPTPEEALDRRDEVSPSGPADGDEFADEFGDEGDEDLG